jgi:predicted DNA-binding transcriptional regulator AlpA
MSKFLVPDVPDVKDKMNKPFSESGNKKFIKSGAFREMLGGVSRATLWRLSKQDPDFPEPHPRFGYVLGEAQAYIEKKAAERSRSNGAT